MKKAWKDLSEEEKKAFIDEKHKTMRRKHPYGCWPTLLFCALFIYLFDLKWYISLVIAFYADVLLMEVIDEVRMDRRKRGGEEGS